MSDYDTIKKLTQELVVVNDTLNFLNRRLSHIEANKLSYLEDTYKEFIYILKFKQVRLRHHIDNLEEYK